MAASHSTSSAKLTCLCGAISLPGSYLKDEKFPIPSALCHCNPCRYTSGGLIPAFADLTGPPPPETKSKLSRYQFSEKCARYFCSTCGAHCFVEHPQKENEWFCTAGIIEPREGVTDVVKLTGHTYVSDTIDGGVTSLFLPITENGGEEIYSAEHSGAKLPPRDLDALAQASRSTPAPREGDLLQARCHCGGVDLLVKRADYATEPKGVRTLMKKESPNQYLARYCTCRSCRLSLGHTLCPWTYFAISSVLNPSTDPPKPITFGEGALAEGANPGQCLKHHQSREDVVRSHCGKCGASIFYYTSDPSRSDVVDIAVGLLRAESGSLAHGWVRWAEGEVSHDEESVDQRLVECVIERGGRV